METTHTNHLVRNGEPGTADRLPITVPQHGTLPPDGQPQNGHSSPNGHAVPSTGSGLAAPASPSPNGSAGSGLDHRLAAQAKTAAQAKRGPADETDTIARRRDEDGQPLPNRVVWLSPPLSSDARVKDTALQRTLGVIDAEFPARGGAFEHLFDDGVQAARQRHLDRERFEWEKLDNDNAEIERRNLALEARRAELEALRDAATAADRQTILALDEPLRQANQEAARACAAAGFDFDPQQPSSVHLMAHQPLSLHALSGGMSLPFEEADQHWGERIARITDIVSGVLFGTSVALLSGIIEASGLRSMDTGTLVIWLVFAGVGAALTVKASEAITGKVREVSERFWLGRPAREWWPMLGWAILAAGALLVVWIVVDANGLMKLAELHSRNGGGAAPLSPPVMFCLGAVAALPFVWFAVARGNKLGRFFAVRNRLLAEQAREFLERDAEIRSRPAFQEALRTIGCVMEIHHQRRALEARVAVTAEPFEVERRTLDAQKADPRSDLGTDAKLRLQDTQQDWAGATAEWAALRDDLLDEIEPRQNPARGAAAGDIARRNRTGLRAPRKKGWLSRIGEGIKRLFGRR